MTNDKDFDITELKSSHTIHVPKDLKTNQLKKEFICLQLKYITSVEVWRKEYILAYTNCSSYGQHYMGHLSENKFWEEWI